MNAELHVLQPAVGTGLRFTTAEQFASVDEPGVDALLGTAGNIVIPENGDVMVYGDGGVGKTTLTIDLGCHLAAGDDWLGVDIPRPVTCGLLENEGPRPLFRDKIERKLAAWQGGELGGRLRVLEEPWAHFTFEDEDHRAALAAAADDCELDVLIAGPLTAIGMNDAGTLQETRLFKGLLDDVRQRMNRRLTFVLIHHENKGGQVSGAWESVGDTLIHVQGQGHGRTRVLFKKARWSSDWHGKALQLLWADGASFTVGETAERDPNEIADAVLAAARANGGCSWNIIETAVKGNAARARTIRDSLLESGRLTNANAGKGGKVMALWDTDDPLRPVRLATDAPQTHYGEEA